MKQKDMFSNKKMIIKEQHQASYSAPIPPPAMLADYNKIDPSFAERILKMAEDQNAASIYTNKTFIDKTFKAKWFGQIFSFTIVLLGFVLAALFEFLKDDSTSLIVAVVPIGIAAVKGMLKN